MTFGALLILWNPVNAGFRACQALRTKPTGVVGWKYPFPTGEALGYVFQENKQDSDSGGR